ncbi:Hypothetical predicted protein [Pelobates cultripes]|uniref:Uncharacterized protein n=1 Tax=Pelobates cultripes TaxID=61616 RepID=A0AAD1T1K3_PELCU|nr:Hypothetical predicted protein [Pelobates cultripes]
MRSEAQWAGETADLPDRSCPLVLIRCPVNPLPLWTDGFDPSPPLGGYPDLLGVTGETTESAGTSSDVSNMVDATRSPDTVQEQLDFTAKLNRAFDIFWQNLE